MKSPPLVINGPGAVPIGQIVLESHGVGGAAATAVHTAATGASGLAQFALGGIAGMVAGAAVGSVQDKIDSAVDGLDKIGHARLGLVAAGGTHLASVHSDNIREWDWGVKDPQGNEIARITKTWAGWAKERFTKATATSCRCTVRFRIRCVRW